MEAVTLELRGEEADRFDEAFVERMARIRRRSINNRGARNIHRYEGDGVTQVAYERAAAHENSWLMVSILIERVDASTNTVVVFVGGGGEGPFKLEELSARRLLRGEEAVGEPGRLATVLRDLDTVAESLDLEVTTRWEGETESSTIRAIAQKVFHS